MTRRWSYLISIVVASQIFIGPASAAQPVRPHYTTKGEELLVNLAVEYSDKGMQIWVTEKNFVISCTTANGSGTLKVKGMATATMTYEGCAIRKAEKPGAEWVQGAENKECIVKSTGKATGKIATGNLKFELVWTPAGENLILNLVEAEGGGNISEIEINAEAGKKCEEGGINLVKTWKLAGSYLTVPTPTGIEQPSISEGSLVNLMVSPAAPGNKMWEVEEGMVKTSGEAKLTLEAVPVAISQKNEVKPTPKPGECPNMGVHE